MRTDKWLQSQFPQLTRRHIQEALDAGWVVDSSNRHMAKGNPVDPKSPPNVEKLAARLVQLQKGNPSLKVAMVAQGDGFWIVDKPAGMPGHPLSLLEENTVTNWAFAHDSAVAEAFSETVQPTITPHRLDVGTSGLLVVAKTPGIYNRWRNYFDAKQVSKVYLAWCWGIPAESVFKINEPLSHDPDDERKMVVGGEYARAAESSIKVIKTLPDCFLAEVRCSTGVTHQVRVHLTSMAHPLLGDELYDPYFETRPLKPAYHQLRAIELATPEGKFIANFDEFSKDPL